MKCTAFQYSSDLLAQFISFPYSLYQNDPFWPIPSRAKEWQQLGPQNPLLEEIVHQKFLVTSDDGQQVYGRILASIHPQIKDQQSGLPLGQFGLFEAINDLQVMELLLQQAEQWLKEQGVSQVMGPMTFTTWNSYRFLSSGHQFPAYLFGPYNKDYYVPFFLSHHYSVLAQYHTIDIQQQNSHSNKLATTTSLRDKAKENNLQLRNMSLSGAGFAWDLRKMYDLSLLCFKDNFLYTAISFDEFRALYINHRSILDPRYILLLENAAGDLVSYVFALPNYIQGVQAMAGKNHLWAKLRFFLHRFNYDSLLIKTMAVHPDYRNVKLGKAMISHLHFLAHQQNICKVVHCLFIADNFSGRYSKHFQSHDTQERTYQLLRKSL